MEGRACMSVTPRWLIVAATVLLAEIGTQAQTPPAALDSLIRTVEVGLTAGDSPGAVRACAEALRQFPDEPAAHACSQKVGPSLDVVVTGATALLGAGDAERALERCSAVLVVSPTNKDAGTCASMARNQIAAHDRDKLKLEQARESLVTGDHARATQALAELGKSEFPDVLKGSVALQDTLNRTATMQVDRDGRAAIQRARLLAGYGNQDEAMKVLQDVLRSNASTDVRNEALGALSDSAPSLRRSFLTSLQHPWAVQFVAVLVLIAGLWVLLHLARDVWRWIDAQFVPGARSRWKFAGVTGDDALGARDPILDALRRVPHEVHKPIWTPTRLLLYPCRDGWDVWENFCIPDEARAKVVHESVFDINVQQAGGDAILSDAFQNLQFTVGNVGVGPVTKFWTGLVEWWHTGEPSFSANCQQLPRDAPKQVVIRLSATGPGGTASVLASTEQEDGVDTVSLTAERAAYKLLFTMSDHRDSAAQIDGHAAFRQGVTLLSRYVRAIADVKEGQAERNSRLLKAINNLEVARTSFDRDRDHRVYHLQSLRFLGVAYALVGRDAVARAILEELEDVADRRPARDTKPRGPQTVSARAAAALRRAFTRKLPSSEAPDPAHEDADRRRDQQLKVEAQFNQAMLYCRMVAEGGDQSRASLAMAETLMDGVAKEDSTLADTVRVWKLLHLNSMGWREWRSLDAATIRTEIDGATTLPDDLKKRADHAIGADRRHNSLLVDHARRNLGIAQLRYLAAFELAPRTLFMNALPSVPNADRSIPENIRRRVETALDFIGASGLLGPLTPNAVLARAYGWLLLSKWLDAEQAARTVLETDKTEQFALYVAAEAALQRGDIMVAHKYCTDAHQIAIVDPALRAFVDSFAFT